MDVDGGANGQSIMLPHALAGGNINNGSLLQKVSTIVAGGVQDPDGVKINKMMEGDEGLTSTSSQQ